MKKTILATLQYAIFSIFQRTFISQYFTGVAILNKLTYILNLIRFEVFFRLYIIGISKNCCMKKIF